MRFRRGVRAVRALCGALLLCGAAVAQAGPAWQAGLQPATVPHGVTRLADLPYGPDPGQVLDVYRPPHPAGPVLVMVHGGGWTRGERGMAAVLGEKLAHWVVARQWVLVSIDYRLAPAVRPPDQARDVARAIAFVQQHARSWGASDGEVVLMGHSAGAHLVALVSAAPALVRAAGGRAWLGTVALDGAALDTPALMARPHLPLYDRAFGADPAVWQASSPTEALSQADPSVPLLLVCSMPRRDDSCAQSRRFADAVQSTGGQASVLPQSLDHLAINRSLGAPGPYTAAVDAWIDALPGLRSR